MKQLLLALVVIATVASCRSSIEASDYDQRCTDDDECIAVDVGDTCKSCNSDGIHVDERARYEADLAAPCPVRFEVVLVLCGVDVQDRPECDVTEAFCDGGTCASRLAPIEE